MVALLLGTWSTVLLTASSERYSSSWWSSTVLLFVQFVVPATGLAVSAALLHRALDEYSKAIGLKPLLQLEPHDIDPKRWPESSADSPAAAHGRRALIRAIIDEELLAIAYQPIVRLPGREIVGVEALSRFPSEPKRGPEEWFADAWECGLGVELELLAIRCALRAQASLPAGVYLSVNASPDTVASSWFQDLMREHPVRSLCIEVTEHAAIEDYTIIELALEPFRLRGLRLAIDDAGAGHAGLRHVVGLRPDVIKLDRSLTQAIGDDLVVRALGSALSSFSAAVGSVMVAEGVETEAQVRDIGSIGVHHAQGYLFGRPAPLSELRLSGSRLP
jgi:EAL domain-containing protein (putative c-di-GMP-specific phosphodiesterase class I)